MASVTARAPGTHALEETGGSGASLPSQNHQLPTKPMAKQSIAYADPNYWDNRYRSQPLEFEWFYGWTALRRIIRGLLPRKKQLLQIGCGNSTLQEGMAKYGYLVTNLDISSVVIEQMRAKHADIGGLEYIVGDCRDMCMFPDCTFWGAFDKGTIDALLCCKEGVVNVHRMCLEISRVLQPGTHFLAITLGEPAQRLHLLARPEYNWTVQVILVPRLPPDQMVQAPGRPLPINDTLKPVVPLGPFLVGSNQTVQGLPDNFQSSHYFYVYACKKAPITLKIDTKVTGLLPESWRSATKEGLAKLSQEKGLHPDLFARGVRTRRVRMSTFMAQQKQQASQSSVAPGDHGQVQDRTSANSNQAENDTDVSAVDSMGSFCSAISNLNVNGGDRHDTADHENCSVTSVTERNGGSDGLIPALHQASVVAPLRTASDSGLPCASRVNRMACIRRSSRLSMEGVPVTVPRAKQDTEFPAGQDSSGDRGDGRASGHSDGVTTGPPSTLSTPTSGPADVSNSDHHLMMSPGPR